MSAEAEMLRASSTTSTMAVGGSAPDVGGNGGSDGSASESEQATPNPSRRSFPASHHQQSQHSAEATSPMPVSASPKVPGGSGSNLANSDSRKRAFKPIPQPPQQQPSSTSIQLQQQQQSRPSKKKKARLDDGAAYDVDSPFPADDSQPLSYPSTLPSSVIAQSSVGGGAGSASGILGYEYPPRAPAMQRNVSAGRTGRNVSQVPQSYAGVDTTTTVYSSTAHLNLSQSSQVNVRRERVVCLVPGSDQIKIGFCEANKPAFFRQLVAYKVHTPASGASGGKSILEAQLLEAESDVNSLGETDTQLLAKARRKRESDLVTLEKILKRRTKTEHARLIPSKGSVKDAENTWVELLHKKTTTGAAANNAAVIPAPPSAAALATAAAAPRTLFSPQLLSASLPSLGAGYVPRRPFSRGGLNISPERGLKQVLGWQEDILREACRTTLQLRASSDFTNSSLSLCVPDSWSNEETALYLDLLMQSIGFKEVLVQKESVAACFGAGLASGLVVDLGAEHVTISCVEEGVLNPRCTRLLQYGFGKDLEETLRESVTDRGFWDLHDQQIDFAEKNPSKIGMGAHAVDIVALRQAEQIKQWKEKYCYCIRGSGGLAGVGGANGSDENKSPSEEDMDTSDAVISAAAASNSALNSVAAGGSGVGVSTFNTLGFGMSIAMSLGFAPHNPPQTPETVPQEFNLAAVFAPLAFFHPSLFPLNVGFQLRQNKFRKQFLEGHESRAAPFEDFLRASAYYPHTDAYLRATMTPALGFDSASLEQDEVVAYVEVSEKRKASAAGANVKKQQLLPEQSGSPNKIIPATASAAAAGATQASSAYGSKRSKRGAGSAAEDSASPAGVKMEDSTTTAGAENANGLAGMTDGNPPLTPLESHFASRPSLVSAIISSLKSLNSLETQTRMASSILVTGGGANLPNFVASLEERLNDVIATSIPGLSTVHMLVHAKGIDSTILSWRGSMIMAKADLPREMWISAEDWKRYGVQLLREKAPFSW